MIVNTHSIKISFLSCTVLKKQEATEKKGKKKKTAYDKLPATISDNNPYPCITVY